MSCLKAQNINKSYGEKLLLDDVAFNISRGDKIALVAKNGEGKSTLLRILAGLERPDGENAEITRDKNLKISYLAQDPELPSEASILDVVFDVQTPAIQAIKKYRRALQTNDPGSIKRSSAVMDDLKAWSTEARIMEVLYLLSLPNVNQSVSELSGGQKKRLALAKTILSEARFFILDEPTNHLDIEMIEWLERYLQNPSLTILMVTHDRYFLDRVCNQIWELNRGHIQIYRGNYSEFLAKKSSSEELVKSAQSKMINLYKKELEWIRRQPKARTSKSKARADQFEELHDRISSFHTPDEISLDLTSQRLGKKILELHNVSKSYDSLVLLEQFNYKFRKGEKLGIVGRNGTGKTTFVDLIMGLITPDTGRIIAGETVSFGYYTQSGMEYRRDETVIESVRNIAEYIELENGQKLTAERLLEKFLFPRVQHRVKIAKLSGGERRRLSLLHVLMKLPNFLILDEPTNDLDIPTLHILEDYLMHFKGCVIAISHDRYFLDKIVDHIFVFRGSGKIKDYNGTYSSYRNQINKEFSKRQADPVTSQFKNNKQEKSERKLSYFEKKEIQQIEKELEKLENEKTQIENQFEQGLENSEDIQTLSVMLGELMKKIHEKEDRWLELSQYL